MSLDDRDYMRDRYRSRRGLGQGTIWNDRKGRVEGDGAWFDPTNRGHDYQTVRRRRSLPVRRHPAQGLLIALSALAPLTGLYYEAKRSGWIPDTREEVPFPKSGDVTVNSDIDPRTAVAEFKVVTADANAVAQLYSVTGEHVLSVYVRKNDRVTTRVPTGTYQLRLVEGQRWYGEGAFFGNSMTFETASEKVRFTRRQGHKIDLHRRPDGNMKTRPNIANPTF